MATSSEEQTLLSVLNPRNWKFKKSHQEEIADLKIKKYLWVFPVLTVLVFSVYLNSLGNSLVSDDKGLLEEGANLAQLQYIFADPLSIIRSIFYALLYQIDGVNPPIFRLLNIFFHLGNTFLVFTIVSLLIKPRVGMITAALFAVHPLLTESVTWISGGPYSQYTFFFLLSFLLYILFRRNKLQRYYWLSLGTFLVGLLSSNRVLTLSLVFLVYEWAMGDVRVNWRRLLPYFSLSIFWGLAYLFQIGGRSTNLAEMTFSSGGTFNPFIQIPFAITSYLELIFYPLELTFYHSDLKLNGLRIAEKWLGLVLLLVGMWVSFRLNRKLFFWLTFFVISLLITLTPFKISQIVAERYVYLGTIGILVVGSYFLDKLISIKETKVVGFLLVGLLVLGLGIRTIYRNTDWKDTDTLMLATVATTPESPRAQNNVGAYYYNLGDLQKAEEHFKAAIANNPRFLDAYRNLVIMYSKNGEKEKAVQLINQGLQYSPHSPLLKNLLLSLSQDSVN